jgi:hypothetical protein
MKPIYSKLILIACSTLFSLPILAQSFINCDLLHGSWAGEHIDSLGNYTRWSASYSAEGEISLIFFDANGNQESVQEGSWECDDDRLSTTLFSGAEKFAFDSKIVSLDDENFFYQSLHDETVFHSVRLEN